MEVLQNSFLFFGGTRKNDIRLLCFEQPQADIWNTVINVSGNLGNTVEEENCCAVFTYAQDSCCAVFTCTPKTAVQFWRHKLVLGGPPKIGHQTLEVLLKRWFNLGRNSENSVCYFGAPPESLSASYFQHQLGKAYVQVLEHISKLRPKVKSLANQGDMPFEISGHWGISTYLLLFWDLVEGEFWLLMTFALLYSFHKHPRLLCSVGGAFGLSPKHHYLRTYSTRSCVHMKIVFLFISERSYQTKNVPKQSGEDRSCNSNAGSLFLFPFPFIMTSYYIVSSMITLTV